MDNITKEQRLLALVASHPPAGLRISSCALRRAGRMMDLTENELGVGRALGFSNTEIHGIMDGWDAVSVWTSHVPGYDRWSSEMGDRVDTGSQEYTAAFELGKRCAAVAQVIR